MHFVKWIRKNERKVMTFVVIFIMVAFVGGTALQQIMSRLGQGGGKEVVAYFYDEGKITRNDFIQARSDLELLRVLRVDQLLTAIDLKSILLGQLLFPDSQSGAMISVRIKQAVAQGQYQISPKEIDDFFNQTGGRGEEFWLLLKAEAKNTGCVVSGEKAKNALKQIIPQVTQGQADAGQLVSYIIEKLRIPEERIISVFADFLGVLTYGRTITNSEDVTIDQIKASIARNGEKLSAEFVKISAAELADMQTEPTEEELYTQFARYKKFFAGQITDENLYGFGYKLPARVQLEYLVVKLDDVRALIEIPKQEELEEYYRRSSERFQYEEKIDPNDPESQTITKTRSYAEVSDQVQQILIQDRTNRRADMIMNEAFELTESGFSQIDFETADSEELKKAAGDYKEAAAKLSEKYNMKIYTGQTGMLSAEAIANDSHLGRLMLEGQSQLPVTLDKVVFAIDELGTTQLSRFEVSKPKMWENIGPTKDMFGSTIALIRVVGAEKVTESVDLNTSFSIKGVVLDETQDAQKDKDVYSIRGAITEDFKLIKAMETAGKRAGELAKMVAEKGWDEAIGEFSKLYTSQIKLETLPDQTRISFADIRTARMYLEDSPAQAAQLKTIMENRLLLEKLYSLIPAGETETVNPGAPGSIVEFKPTPCYYVVKKISRTAVTQRDYQMSKSQVAFMLDQARAESLGIVFYKPGNILKRMNYRTANQDDRDSTEDKNAEQPDGES